MPSNSVEEYLISLQEKAKELKEKYESLEQAILEVELGFELRKNKLMETVSSSLRGYKPKGLNLSLTSPDDENIQKHLKPQNLTKVLKSIFKLH